MRYHIGLIDSGIGGFSILQAFLKSSYFADYSYIADSAYLPYGLKSAEEIHSRMMQLSKYLIQEKCVDALVIACNTATAISAEKLRAQFPQSPIIGIEPAIKSAALATHSKHIAVAATAATLNSDRLQHLISRYASHLTVHKIVGTDWVTLVESGDLQTPKAESILRRSLSPFQQYPIDQLVLGCTHFPFLTSALKNILPPHITLIDPAPAIVRETFKRLRKKQLTPLISPLSSPYNVDLYTTGDLKPYQVQAELLTLPHHQKRVFHLPR